jgi:hypothetical protein
VPPTPLILANPSTDTNALQIHDAVRIRLRLLPAVVRDSLGSVPSRDVSPPSEQQKMIRPAHLGKPRHLEVVRLVEGEAVVNAGGYDDRVAGGVGEGDPCVQGILVGGLRARPHQVITRLLAMTKTIRRHRRAP